MNKVLKMSQLSFELISLEKEKKALYLKESQIKEEMRMLAESILVDTREGKTLEMLLEKE